MRKGDEGDEHLFIMAMFGIRHFLLSKNSGQATQYTAASVQTQRHAEDDPR